MKRMTLAVSPGLPLRERHAEPRCGSRRPGWKRKVTALAALSLVWACWVPSDPTLVDVRGADRTPGDAWPRPGTAVVGRVPPGARCPSLRLADNPASSTRRLFSLSSEPGEWPTERPVPALLEDYCVGSVPQLLGEQRTEALQELAELGFYPDMGLGQPHGELERALTRHGAHFADNVRPITWTGPGPGAPVRLVILDTLPGWGAQDPHSHGLTLAATAQALLCEPGEACPVQVTPAVALAVRAPRGRTGAWTRDLERGGSQGDLHGVARAIRRSVVALVGEAHDATVKPDAPVVFNLSIGFDPGELGSGGNPADIERLAPPAQALAAALVDARCRGVIPIVSAGNRSSDGPAKASALIPAAWMEETGAHEWCAEVLPVDTPPRWTQGEPLVYAASAVDHRGRDLTQTRPGSRTALAAFGNHALMSARLPARVELEDLDTLTGSSMSALVLSALAAASLTASDPESTAPHDRIMRRLHASARPRDPAMQAQLAPSWPQGPPSSDARIIDGCVVAELVEQWDCHTANEPRHFVSN